MGMHSSRKGIFVLLFIAAAVFPAFCQQFQEGFDTTDANGHARNSLFDIVQNQIVLETGSKIVQYGLPGFHSGYFNHAFDDIQKVPDSIITNIHYFAMNSCYAIQKGRNLYAKICILKKLSDGRYVYRYARNAINQLVNQFNSRPKPNNVFFEEYYDMPITNVNITWEPPLKTFTQLKGYILYLSKREAVIDTSKPINMAQWDSIAYTTKDSLKFQAHSGGYFNLVAVYNDGKSDFLKGWSRLEMLVDVAPSVSSHSHLPYPSLVTLRKTFNGYRIDLGGLPISNLPESIIFYLINGRQIARIDGIKEGQLLLPTFHAQGPSLFKMIFSDNSEISGQCRTIQ